MANRWHYEKTIRSHRPSAGDADKKTFYRGYVLGFKEINGIIMVRRRFLRSTIEKMESLGAVNARALDARIREKDFLYKIDLCIYITPQLPHPPCVSKRNEDYRKDRGEIKQQREAPKYAGSRSAEAQASF